MTLNSLVSVSWLQEHWNLPGLLILDTSPRSNVSNLEVTFPGIQIKGARKFDMEKVFYDENQSFPNMMPGPEKFTKECQNLGINNDSFIVVYDNLGIYTGPRVWWMFKVMGQKNIAVLDGGLSAWKKEGGFCESIKANNVEKGNFKAIYLPDLVVDTSFLMDNLRSHKSQVVDARSIGRFNGELPEPRANMASGHIPHSLNLPFKEVLTGDKMKSDEALKEIFSELNISGQPIVFTCGSGITACVILLAAEQVLENKKSLFDGSWSEWGYKNKFPVE